jgi:hypothetical protein
MSEVYVKTIDLLVIFTSLITIIPTHTGVFPAFLPR